MVSAANPGNKSSGKFYEFLKRKTFSSDSWADLGHLGDFNELMLAGTLSGIEMGLALAKVLFSKGGVTEALDYLSTRP